MVVHLLLVAALATPPPGWNVNPGTWTRGGDAVPAANMTLAAAEQYCAALANCSAFTFETNTSTPKGIIKAYFKDYATSWSNNPKWWIYSKPAALVRTCDKSSPSYGLPNSMFSLMVLF